MDRWVREVEEHAPGIPKVLVGNRLHLAFKRQVDQTEAESYAERNHMGFYEVCANDMMVSDLNYNFVFRSRLWSTST